VTAHRLLTVDMDPELGGMPVLGWRTYRFEDNTFVLRVDVLVWHPEYENTDYQEHRTWCFYINRDGTYVSASTPWYPFR
jgi:hypothetical protein